ncbi:lipopolysaccharide biosynthesis protein [Devosia sp.]|uniref:lipopolysaccharide biosynthesis protein n=1 Tax=Devosia sp. TaxID=1871048 RepID=UPI002930BFC7|nr:oligosaccharide flippase family protein [Devosia sp.]
MKLPSVKGLVRSVAVLASGTAASQVILLLAAPILTRLYTPDQFGLLAAYMATVTILGAISTLRYELIIPLPRRHDMAANALALTLGCVLVAALLTAFVLIVFGPQLATLFNAPDLPRYSWLIPLGVLSMGSYTAFNNWAVRRRSFGIIARTKLTQSVSQTAIQIGAAFTPFATLGLLVGSLLGQSMGISSFVRAFFTKDRATIPHIGLRRIWFLARHYWHFPALSLPASVAFTASQQAPALVLFSQFGAATAGFYLLAQRVGMMPATLLGTAVSQSIYRNLADRRRDPKAIGQMVLVPVQIMNTLIIAPAVFCAVIAPLAVEIAFGREWIEAGHYLRWMAPWVATTITFGAMSPVVSVLGLQKMGLFFQVGSLALSLAAMIVCGTIWGSIAAIAAFSLTKTATIILYRLHMFTLLGVSPRPVALSIGVQAIGYAAVFVLAEQLLRNATTTHSLWIFIAVAVILLCTAVVYAVNALRSARQLSGLRSTKGSSRPDQDIIEPDS